jgi:hypothetical protein
MNSMVNGVSYESSSLKTSISAFSKRGLKAPEVADFTVDPNLNQPVTG